MAKYVLFRLSVQFFFSLGKIFTSSSRQLREGQGGGNRRDARHLLPPTLAPPHEVLYKVYIYEHIVNFFHELLVNIASGDRGGVHHELSPARTGVSAKGSFMSVIHGAVHHERTGLSARGPLCLPSAEKLFSFFLPTPAKDGGEGQLGAGTDDNGVIRKLVN
jgi:hypothetical protein